MTYCRVFNNHKVQLETHYCGLVGIDGRSGSRGGTEGCAFCCCAGLQTKY